MSKSLTFLLNSFSLIDMATVQGIHDGTNELLVVLKTSKMWRHLQLY